jgi:hypothetical protein
MMLLGRIQYMPGSRFQDETASDQDESQNVERAKMWICLPAANHLEHQACWYRAAQDARTGAEPSPRACLSVEV